MTDYLAQLETYTEEAVQAYVDAWVHWRMEDWGADWLSGILVNIDRYGDIDGGWCMRDVIAGTHVKWRSPTTGNAPDPLYGAQVSDWTIDEAEQEYENYGKILRDWLAPWRSLPEEGDLVLACETMLESAWQINWEDPDLDVVPDLDTWLKDVERDDTGSNYGRTFNAFYDKYGATREILSHNLRHRLIDVAGVGAADANAINRAKASILDLVKALRDTLRGAKPGGSGSGSAAWDTLGLVTSVLPGGGVVDVVKGAIGGAKEAYGSSSGTSYSFSGERPVDVHNSWVGGHGGLEEFTDDFNEGMGELVRVCADITTSLEDDTRSALSPAVEGDAVGMVSISDQEIEETKSALLDLSRHAKAPIPDIALHSGLFARSSTLTNPFDTLREGQELVITRLRQIGNDLTDGRDDLIAAHQLFQQTDSWSNEALKTLLGFV
ncbi:hypothetical protein ACFQ0K_10595 [Nocardioides caeni]|uniref:Uncharacterized protein n=1 Tax=Nocardioides caeni TaxID=574700 RepID=A0A4S8N0Q2_9ACTN|nr:hypothetical protein [Nocardioides caeni]THV09350.1 hypothetical protein E9934_16565 [Nocardioides caeni]